MILNIRHSALPVYDLEGAICFYTDLLGMTVYKRDRLTEEQVTGLLNIKGTALEWVKLKASEDDKTFIELYYFEDDNFREMYFRSRALDSKHIALTVASAEEVYERLAQIEIINILKKPQKDAEGKHKLFFVRDYDGNLLELVEVLK